MNPRTKLGEGDMHRVAAIFGFMALMGIIGAFLIFPVYEASLGRILC